ncbi:MAG: ABC transporter ATP-binding protein [Candidatus Aminicenantes bacterium]|nr:ABC transporter ATP-binding protein [Candidatus Aminicenantes bacterium]
MGILEVKSLHAGYGGGDVIQKIDLCLEKGEFACILGPNGSGKSTLIKALQGLLKDVSGRIAIDGTDLFRLTRREISRKIAFVPQIADLTFDFSVFELVAMGRYVHQGRLSGLSSADRRLLQEVLEMVEIAPLQNKKVAHLSGGERQRVMIARALAQDTPLLFLDEPSSHLDINYGLEIFAILAKLQGERGKTILSTEHNINLAIPYVGKIIFLKEGRVLAQGAPAEMITRDKIKNVFQADVDIRENRHSQLPEISLIPKRSPKPQAQK